LKQIGPYTKLENFPAHADFFGPAPIKIDRHAAADTMTSAQGSRDITLSIV